MCNKKVLNLNDVTDGHVLDNGEIVYVCPVCKERHSRENYTKRKLYYNPKKKIGHCFVCETILVGENSFNINDFDLSNISFEKYVNQNNPKIILKEKEDQYLKQKFCFTGLTKITKELNQDLFLYLTEKRKLNPIILKEYVFRFFELKNNKKGIFIGANLIDEKHVDFFQIRNTDEKVTPKYLSSPDSIKPFGFYSRLQKGNNAIICEGFFSALSASQHLNFKYKPLVLFGKKITDFQKNQFNKFLKNIYLEELVCCLDGGYEKENKGLFEEFKLNSNIKKVTFISLPENKDPNDLEKEDFLFFFNKRKDLFF